MDISKIEFGKRYQLGLPGEDVDEQGQENILLLLGKALATHNDDPKQVAAYSVNIRRNLPETWTWRWQQPNGKYAGNLTKRLQSFMYKQYGYKVLPALVTEIGNQAKIHSTEPAEFYFDFTNDLSWKKGAFGDGASCFSADDEHMRLLQDVQCWAMRLYAGMEPKAKGLGRMWLYPFSGDPKEPHVPAGTVPAAFVGFNAYGTFRKEYQVQVFAKDEGGDDGIRTYGVMQTLDYSRLLALFLGVSYSQIHITAAGYHKTPGPMYFNNGGKSAVIVAPVEVVAQYKPKKDGDEFVPVTLDLGWTRAFLNRLMPTCPLCNERLGRPDRYGNPREPVDVPDQKTPICSKCFRDHYRKCQVCDVAGYKDKMPRFVVHEHEYWYCRKHAATHTLECSGCGRKEHLLSVRRILTRNAKTKRLQMANYCKRCVQYIEEVFSCAECGVIFKSDDMHPDKLPVPLKVECPRCRAKGKRNKADAVPADEEIDPVDAVFERVVKPLTPKYQRRHELYDLVAQDGDQYYLLDHPETIGLLDAIPANRPYRGFGWATPQYTPDVGAALVTPLPPGLAEILQAVRLPVRADRPAIDRLLDIGRPVVHNLHNCAIVAVSLGLDVETLRTRFYDPILNWNGGYEITDTELRHRGERGELAADDRNIDDTSLRTMGVFSALVESEPFFRDTLALLQTKVGEVKAARWYPDGRMKLSDNNAALMDRLYPDLVRYDRLRVIKERKLAEAYKLDFVKRGAWDEMRNPAPEPVLEKRPNGDILHSSQSVRAVMKMLNIAEEPAGLYRYSPVHKSFGSWAVPNPDAPFGVGLFTPVNVNIDAGPMTLGWNEVASWLALHEVVFKWLCRVPFGNMASLWVWTPTGHPVNPNRYTSQIEVSTADGHRVGVIWTGPGGIMIE